MIVSLTSCSGCISTLMGLDIFPQMLERSKELFFPFLTDVEDMDDYDIALIEGCVSQENQIDELKKIRQHSKKVYALGTCAAFGGILSLSKVKDARPISNFIEIDGFIPGCPPPSKFMGNFLIRMMEGKEIELSNKNLCSNCPIRGNFDLKSEIEITRFEPNPEEISEFDENTKCFLEQGILCLGPVTREGCEHKCISQGMPCEGCMGPASKDFTSNIVNFLSLVNLSANLRKYDGIFYRFSKPNIKR